MKSNQTKICPSSLRTLALHSSKSAKIIRTSKPTSQPLWTGTLLKMNQKIRKMMLILLINLWKSMSTNKIMYQLPNVWKRCVKKTSAVLRHLHSVLRTKIVFKKNTSETTLPTLLLKIWLRTDVLRWLVP